MLKKESNPLVLANLVAAMNEMSIQSGKNIIEIDSQTLSKLLMAVNDCIEWG